MLIRIAYAGIAERDGALYGLRMIIDRRKLLTGLIAAPLVVPVNRLMKLRGTVLRLYSYSFIRRVDGGKPERVEGLVAADAGGLIRLPVASCGREIIYYGMQIEAV